MGSFVQKRIGDKLVAARVEWHTVQGATGKRGCFRGVNLMKLVQPFFFIDNRSLRDLSLATPTTAGSTQVWPAGVSIKQRIRVDIADRNGSATYHCGDVGDALVSWTSGQGAPTLQCSTGAVRMLVWVYSPAQQAAVTAAESPADDTETLPAGGQTDAARLSEGPAAAQPRHHLPPKGRAGSAPKGDLGAVTFYERVRIRIDNQSGEDLALISSNVALELDALTGRSETADKAWNAAAAAGPDMGPNPTNKQIRAAKVTATAAEDHAAAAAGASEATLAAGLSPPPIVANGDHAEFLAYTYPRAFADYAIAKSDWTSCWVTISWGAGGPTAAARSHTGASSFLNARTTRLPDPSPDGDTIFVVRIERAARRVAIAPVTPTTRDRYLTLIDPNVPSKGSAIGHAAHTAGRSVLGCDVSAYQSMDFRQLTDWVDSQGRRAWFVAAKVSQGYGVDTAFRKHWEKLAQTRFLRFPYHFVDALSVRDHANDRELQAQADIQFEKFKAHYLAGGGWRPYDLPPAIDFEPVYPPRPADTTAAQRKSAWTYVTVLRTFIRRLTALFHTPPFLYSFSSSLHGWYPVAKLGFEQERPGETWSDSWLAPLLTCRIWHAAYPPQVTPTTRTSSTWPWQRPNGYTGQWFVGDWSIYQFGVTELPDPAPPRLTVNARADAAARAEDADPAVNALPNADSATLGARNRDGGNGQLDLDVWNGSLDDLVRVALATRWDPRA
jgi:hypothetical protein